MKTTFLFGALSLALAACRSREAPRSPVVVRNPDYLVVRSLTPEEDPEHKLRVVLPYAGAGYAFAAATPLLDLDSFDLAQARRSGDDLAGGVTLWIPLKPEGSRSLEAWSARHSGERLGVFLRGKLVEAPRVRNRIGAGIPLTLASKAEGDRVLKELASGGATD